MSRLTQRCCHLVILLVTLAESHGANPSRFVHVIVADNNTNLVALAAVNQVPVHLVTNKLTFGVARAPDTPTSFLTYPDDTGYRGGGLGVSRFAMAPLLSWQLQQVSGAQSDWVFIGPAHTLFFEDAALQLVADLNPAQPHFLTDHLWWSEGNFQGGKHPSWTAPRCAPCGLGPYTALPETMPRGCPCTPQTLCQHGHPGLNNYIETCGIPRMPTRAYSMHMGAGALLSRGLLQGLDDSRFKRCVHSEYTSGPDATLTICLWQQGFAITDPDPGHRLKQDTLCTLMDPDPAVSTLPGPYAKANDMITNALQDVLGTCSPDCQAGLRKTISLDMYSAAPNSTAAQAAVALLVTAARAAQARHEHILAGGKAATPLRLTRATIHPMWEGLGRDLGLVGRLNRTLTAMQATQVSGQLSEGAKSRHGAVLREMTAKAERNVASVVVQQLLEGVVGDAEAWGSSQTTQGDPQGVLAYEGAGRKLPPGQTGQGTRTEPGSGAQGSGAQEAGARPGKGQRPKVNGIMRRRREKASLSKLKAVQDA